jgi:hypothetical protein
MLQRARAENGRMVLILGESLVKGNWAAVEAWIARHRPYS